MVVGIGVDIIEISRLSHALDEHGERLRKRVFTEGEIAYCLADGRANERFAARFAAKEAARKALGAATPIETLGWREVEIISSREGAPHIEFHGRASNIVRSLGITRAHLSMSHGRDHAVAMVVLERD
ncbi:MAG: holo-ACP synthase [Acidobacteria bacterium]|nr:holo-ACP synthase [Acidobacteriota bacterium]MCW5970460.1 holo-ACP synthase [Blastocatellales bacterium]